MIRIDVLVTVPVRMLNWVRRLLSPSPGGGARHYVATVVSRKRNELPRHLQR